MGRCSVVGIATGWAVRRSNPGGGREIFRIGPDRHSGTPSLLYNGYRVFPGGKERPERDADPSPLSSAVGHERVELYLYFPVGRTACTEPQCLYKGALYLYSRAIPLLLLWAVRACTEPQCLYKGDLYLYSSIRETCSPQNTNVFSTLGTVRR